MKIIYIFLVCIKNDMLYGHIIHRKKQVKGNNKCQKLLTFPNSFTNIIIKIYLFVNIWDIK